MSNELTTQQVTDKLLEDYFKTLTASLTNPERLQFCAIAKEMNLNPFKREIYAVKYGNTFNVLTGYEVYLKRAESNPNFDGYETEFFGSGKDLACKCTVYRKDRNHPTTSIVYMVEYNTGKSLWVSKPNVMLEKVAIATAFRRAFPTDFGGMPYTSDEMPTAEPIAQHQPAKAENKPAKAKKDDDNVIDAEVVENPAEAAKTQKKDSYTDEEKKKSFAKMVEPYVNRDKNLFLLVLGNEGYESIDEIPVDKLNPMYKKIKAAFTAKDN